MQKPRISRLSHHLQRGVGFNAPSGHVLDNTDPSSSHSIYDISLLSHILDPKLQFTSLSFYAYPVRKMKTQVELKFSSFFEKWMCLLEEFLRYYLRVSAQNSQEVDHEVLVNKLTAHHKEYYTYKWAAAHEDVLAFFAPVWLSPVENVNLWITGWKPSIAFRLIESLRKIQSPGASLATMTDEQVRKIEALRVKIKMDEDKVEREFERQQVGMADRKMVKLAALEKRVVKNGESAVNQLNELVEMAMKGLLGGLEKVMKMADCVRLKTLKGVLDILTPIQSVDFLAAMSMVQIRMRKWGKRHDKNLQ